MLAHRLRYKPKLNRHWIRVSSILSSWWKPISQKNMKNSCTIYNLSPENFRLNDFELCSARPDDLDDYIMQAHSQVLILQFCHNSSKLDCMPAMPLLIYRHKVPRHTVHKMTYQLEAVPDSLYDERKLFAMLSKNGGGFHIRPYSCVGSRGATSPCDI